MCTMLFVTSHAWSAPTPAQPIAPGVGASGPKDADVEAQIARAREAQQRLLKQIRADLARIPPGVPGRAQKERLLAAIEQRIADEDGAVSRIRYMSSEARSGEVFGPYCAEMRHRIERWGSDHFPVSKGRKLYGRVTLNLRIDVAGRLVETDLVTRSGSAELDRSARDIAASAAPFGAFTSRMKSQADAIVYTAYFNFTHSSSGDSSVPAASAPDPGKN